MESLERIYQDASIQNQEYKRITTTLQEELKRLESKNLNTHAEMIKNVDLMHQVANEKGLLEHKIETLTQDNQNLVSKLENATKSFKEKWEKESQSLHLSFAAERKKLHLEIYELSEQLVKSNQTSDRAVRDKRSAENELSKLTRHIPQQMDALEMTLEELHSKLRASERERMETCYKLESYFILF